MVRITLTAELLGVSGGHGSMAAYNKRFSAVNGRNTNLACLADMQAAAARSQCAGLCACPASAPSVHGGYL